MNRQEIQAWEIVTPSTVQHETYHNLCRLSDLLRFSTPHTAMVELNISVAVWKDECGNIVRLA